MVVGVMATCMAIYVPNTNGLLVLAGDMQYLLFPHLVAALYIPWCNTYGSIVSFFTSLILRLLLGEHTLYLPAYIRFPWYDDEHNMQMFPCRTCIVVISMILLMAVSVMTKLLAKHSSAFKQLDQRTFKCFVQDSRVRNLSQTNSI